MQPANDPHTDYRKLVQDGYDRCAAAYDQARQREPEPELAMLIDQLEPGATVLDLGCGAGVPVARELAQRFAVTGVDISEEQTRRAQHNVPTATFLQADLLTISFPSSAFDAIVAFYSIFHTPREEHRQLFRHIHHWLKPQGYLLATFASQDEEPYTQDDFFGQRMYWSNFGLDQYQVMLQDAGFELLQTTILEHGYDQHGVPAEQHPLILARKSASHGL